MELKSFQRKYLREQAHHLKPAVNIGKNGVTDTVIKALEDSLTAHELIKVKFIADKDQKNEICDVLVERTSATLVGVIGHIATFYRESEVPENRLIRLPRK